MAIIDGRTTANPYVTNVDSVDPTTGKNPNYKIIPLLTVGDEVPLLEGEFGKFTTSSTQKFAMAGIPDGLGITKIGDRFYVWMNHEIANAISDISTNPADGKIEGARVSLYVFDADWKVIGGKNLIETVSADGETYTWNPTTGNYETATGEILNTLDHTNFTRFCSAYLAAEGFVDEKGNSVPIFFSPEESTDSPATGSFARSRGWATDVNGNSVAIDGLGIYAKEQVLAASQYRATNSDYTVLLSTEDFANGEIYAYVGRQTADNPNGITNDPSLFDLYVLRVEDAEGKVFAYETMPENVSLKAKWTLVPDQAALGSQERLSQWVDGLNRSTNFRRPEDIHEDPNQPGTFYFVTTGSNDFIPGTQTQDNTSGKLHRFNFSLDANGKPQDGKFEYLLSGGKDTGISYDNIVVDTNGNVIIQEDPTAAGDILVVQQQRNARVLSYNIAFNEGRVANDQITFLFEAEQNAAGSQFNTEFGAWETSGIVQVPGTEGTYLFDVQASTVRDEAVLGGRFVRGGQLLLTVPEAPAAVPTLVGFASLPADTFAPGPQSGSAITSPNRPTPFPSQPVQGFSGVQFADHDSFWFLADNGYGSKANSADFLLRIYRVDADFKTLNAGTGKVEWKEFVQLSDPNKLIPFTIVNQNTSDRLLTGADFDPESIVVAKDGSFWIGDEFGPYLLHFNAAGVLQSAPIPTPNLGQLNTLNGQTPLVIGHRGASGLRPEHTLEAYKLAIEQGADFIEPDLVSTKDGFLVARHEPNIKDTTNVADIPAFASRRTTRVVDGVSEEGWFTNDFTLAELKTLKARQSHPYRPQEFNDQFAVPTLDEIIDLVQQVEADTGKKIGIYPETKHPTYFDNLGLSLEEKLIKTLLDQGFTDPNRIFIQSFEVSNLIELKTKLLPGTALKDTPLIQLYDVFDAQPYDIVANFATANFNPVPVYGSNAITADTNYGDLINQDNNATQNLLADFVADYASGIGPWKRTFVLTKPVNPPVDGNGDGTAEIAEQLTGQVLPVVADAHAAGLQVHPYTFRNEERFLVLNPNGTPQTAQQEYLQFISLGVDGYFTDFPATGDTARDIVAQDFVFSPDNPKVIAGEALANLARSRGFEGMAFSPDRQTLYPLLEGTVAGDPANSLRIYKFDVATQKFAPELAGFYRLSSPDHAIGDFTPINETEFLVIERDNLEGPAAAFKKIFKVDLSKKDATGFVQKEELVNLLNIADPNDLNGDGSKRFDFPFQTIENIIVLDENTLLLANDNNYPFSVGRPPAIDNNEIIQIDLPTNLNLSPLLGQPQAPVSDTIFGTNGDDRFDSEFPGTSGFTGNNQILFTSAGNDYVDVSLAVGGNRLDLGSGDDIIFAGSNNRIIGGSGKDKFFLGNPTGNNVVSGGSDADQFWLVTDEGDLPTKPNIITDFTRGTDVIGFGGTNLTFADLILTQDGSNTIVKALGQDLAILNNILASSLNATNFVFA
jgi:glycerophosphoryl diester phosphodiesterase